MALKILLSSFSILAGILILSEYLTHLSMVRGEQKEGDAKPRYISLQETLRKLSYYKEDLQLHKDFRGSIFWCPYGEKLRSLYLIGMEITPIDEWYKVIHDISDAESKFYWHAGILRIDRDLRWMDPFGYYAFMIYTRYFLKLHLRDTDTEWPEFQAAQRIFEQKYPEKVREYNEQHS